MKNKEDDLVKALIDRLDRSLPLLEQIAMDVDAIQRDVSENSLLLRGSVYEQQPIWPGPDAKVVRMIKIKVL